MEKYINIKQLYQCETCSHHFSGKCDTWCECGESYRPAMVLLNIVEFEEVRHGEWLDLNPTEWECSECHYKVERWNNTPYCPRCGAKMDRKKEEE